MPLARRGRAARKLEGVGRGPTGVAASVRFRSEGWVHVVPKIATRLTRGANPWFAREKRVKHSIIERSSIFKG